MAKKNHEDDEFEKSIRDFIDNFNIDDDDDDTVWIPDDDDDLDSDLNNPPSDVSLPFPKEMNARVANAKLNPDGSENHFFTDVARVTFEVDQLYGMDCLWDAPVLVTLHPRRKAYLSNHRFRCFVYNDTYYPMCCSDEDAGEKRDHSRSVTIPMRGYQIWVPGRYILLIDDAKSIATIQVEFSLDEDLHATMGEPRLCQSGGIEEVLTNCLQDRDDDWKRIAHMPGMAQFRMRAMQIRRLMVFNELLKENEYLEFNTSQNLLICTRNDDIDKYALQRFQRLMTIDLKPKVVDAASLFNLALNNPYEPLNELMADTDIQMLCLTNLKELASSNGKVMMRRIIEKVRDADGSLPFWLCGTRQEIDELLNIYPSLRQLFFADSYVEQQPYTAFELVQAFYDDIARENMLPDVIVKNRLSRAVLYGFKQGVISGWTLADVHRFVVEQIRPRFLQRSMDSMFKFSAPQMQEEDVPFEKLTSGSSAFDDAMRELNEMIGLDAVKQGIMTMSHQARLLQERRRRGLHTSGDMVFHSIFTGNPGTGKTTVARRLGRLYHSMGLLSCGEVIAVDRTRLVGQYIGQTEENMKVILEEAKGNVLFIDEAYTLVTCADDKKDFGRRVLDSLLTVLTQPNPDMLIVFAGYEREMEAMLASNPGLSGRFPFRYQFQDYSADQLMQIARRLLERDEYILTPEADAEMQRAINLTLSQKMPNFGNARWIEQFVRNGIIPAMADRIFTVGSLDLQHIEAEDVEKAFSKFNPKAIGLKPRRHVVTGFTA